MLSRRHRPRGGRSRVHPALAQLKVSISGEAREEISTAAFVDRYSTLAHYVGATTGNDIRLSFGRDLDAPSSSARARAATTS